tara:strand:+ start:258 stop:710 length:453 start_codon:yes stop_codon:yes gene_type:complete
MKKIKSYLAYIIAISVILLDQLTKLLITNNLELNSSIPLIKNILHFTYITNTGSLFGLFQNSKFFNILILIISFAVIISLIYLLQKDNNKKLNILYGLLLGGTIGNLIDRIIHSHVIDFIDIRVWPIFNIADSAISISLILLLIYFWKEN